MPPKNNGSGGETQRPAPFVLVESRGDEPPELIKPDRGGDHSRRDKDDLQFQRERIRYPAQGQLVIVAGSGAMPVEGVEWFAE
jgi:hypothetical protein